MKDRIIYEKIKKALSRHPAVALLGPRQVGKTTISKAIGREIDSVYLDLEKPFDLSALENVSLFAEQNKGKLIILDEVHRKPRLFDELRGIIDLAREEGRRSGQFLLLGSASWELMQQAETLAGRVVPLEMTPLTLAEVEPDDMLQLWLRGGYPDSFLANDDEHSAEYRDALIRMYMERDVPMFAPRMPVSHVDRLWQMLAHSHGSLLNVSQLAGSLGVQSREANAYLGLLQDLPLIRQLQPWSTSQQGRFTKSPKTFIRDSGLLHALLGIETMNDLLGHPIVGASWEGFVIESVLSNVPRRTIASHVRSYSGAEVDLLLEMPKAKWVIESKFSPVPTVTKGFYSVCEAVEPDKAFIVHSGKDSYPKSELVQVVSLPELVSELRSMQ